MSCKIILENYPGVYYPGNPIRGRLECYFSEETSVRGIKVRFKCKEFNEWTTRRKSSTVTNTGDHDIIRLEQLLFGSVSGSTRQLGEGTHVYNFIFLLPLLVPSSFNGSYGSISYKLKGIVDRPMRFDYEDIFIFNVRSPIDLNQPEYIKFLEAVTYSDDKTVCCWCCQGGSINLDVEFPKTAFAVGESVPFKVQISNKSNSNVDELKIRLKKKITFRVTSPSKKEKRETEKILSMQEHGVDAHGEYIYNLNLNIPPDIEAPNFAGCDLFSVDYKLSIICVMPTCVLDLDIDIYPKIGHIAALSMEQQDSYSGTSSPQHQQVPYPENGTFVPLLPPEPVEYDLGLPGYPDKPSYPGDMPTAPLAGDNSNAPEAAGNNSQSGGASAPDLPPPSYHEACLNK